MAVAFESKSILTCDSVDKTIKLWNKNSSVLLQTLNGHEAVASVAFDSIYLLASGSVDKTIEIWNNKMVICSELLLAILTRSFSGI